MFKTSPRAFNLLKVLLSASVFAAASTSLPAYAAKEQMAEPMTAFKTWKDLRVTESLSDDGSVNYYSFPLKNGTKAHLCILDLKSKKYCVRPHVNNPTCPTSAAGAQKNAVAAVNGGFFNLSDGESTSFAVLDGKQVCDPTANKDLITNPKLMPFLETIFNRSELRIGSGKGNAVTIARHKELPARDKKIQFLLGGGPQLLPKLTSMEEAFIRVGSGGKQIDSIGCNKTAARTAIGITPDDHFLILCVAGKGQDEFSSGLTLEQVAQLLSNLGCTRALNFDGGTSTTMAIVDKSAPDGALKMVCGRSPETRVKSVLLIVPR
ncbi:MAG: phosphodiester glycosidase family protein [Candidatus Melainabacteria bacterium]|nr:phosphodiester glycosidase family protein [Candidatus Melainabacteria bacterium]